MPRYQTIQNSFSSGEISPKVFPRVDTAEYSNGLKELDRFCLGRTGGAFKTPGFLSDGKSATGDHFYYYKTQRNGESVLFNFTAAGITGISLTVPALANYILAHTEDPTGFTLVHANGFYVITHNSGNYEPWVAFKDLKVSDTFITGSQFSGLEALMIAQSVQGTPGNIPNEDIVPYTDFGVNTTTLTPSATSGSITLTASATFFTSDDIGSIFIIEDPTHSDTSQAVLNCTITAVGGATTATATVNWLAGSYTAAASTSWVRSAWSEKLGYPKTVTFSNNRLVFANTKTQPNGVWASEQYFFFWFNRYTEFIKSNVSTTSFYYYGSFGYIYINSVTVSPPQVSAFYYTIASSSGGEIKWLDDFNGLIAGASDRIFYITGADGTGPSRSSINISPVSNMRCSFIRPEFSRDTMFVVDALRRNVVMLSPSRENGGLSTVTVSNIAEGILDYDQENDSTEIVTMAWSEYTNSLWLVTTSKNVFTFSYMQESGVAGWAKQSINADVEWCEANYDTGKISLSATLPVSLSSAVVSLTMADFFYGNTLGAECKYLDFGFSGTSLGSGAAITPGIDYNYLHGTTATVIDETGAIYEVAIDGSGVFSLSTAAALDYTIGLPYTSQLATLTPNIGANQLLNSQGDILRIDRVTAYLYKTWGGQYSGDDVNFYDMEIPVESNTRKYQFDLNSSPDIESSVTIRSSGALPLNVTGLVMRGNNNP